MPPAFEDARLRELRFLADVERRQPSLDPNKIDLPTRDMIASLILDGSLNALSNGWSYDSNLGRFDPVGTQNELFRRIEYHRWESLNRLLGGQEVTLSISHKGRVRLSELRQALRTNRERDPSGILIDQRHVERDAAIAVLEAAPEAPLTVSFLDMNGLKTINDTLGHHKGDEVIEVFFHSISNAVQGRGEAYRRGGDEVVVIAPRTTAALAKKMLVKTLGQMAKEHVEGVSEPLTASCGVVTTTDPAADAEVLLRDADQSMYRAKAESKKHPTRTSTIAVGQEPVEVVGL